MRTRRTLRTVKWGPGGPSKTVYSRGWRSFKDCLFPGLEVPQNSLFFPGGGPSEQSFLPGRRSLLLLVLPGWRSLLLLFRPGITRSNVSSQHHEEQYVIPAARGAETSVRHHGEQSPQSGITGSSVVSRHHGEQCGIPASPRVLQERAFSSSFEKVEKLFGYFLHFSENGNKDVSALSALSDKTRHSAACERCAGLYSRMLEDQRTVRDITD